MKKRRLNIRLFLLSVIIFICLPIAGFGGNKRIVFFYPTSENNTYWPEVFKLLDTVSEDLDIKIAAYEFDVRDRFRKHLRGVEILKSKPTPDGAIFSVAFGNTKPLLDTAELLNIPVFIQGPLFPKELPEVGYRPREKYKSWVGLFYQDESKKGYLLGKTLIAAARRAGAYGRDGRIHVVGVGGDSSWFGSKLREDGLKKAVNEDPEADLSQVVPTKWTPEEGKEKAALLLKRYPDATVVWAASDQLGIGAAGAAEASGKSLDKTCFVGGLDLSEVGLNKVKEGELVATVSSSMLAYSQIMIYLYDYLHGIDFADEVGVEISTEIYTATRENADLFLSLSRRYDDIDFRRFSKVYNGLKQYDFSLDAFMQAMENTD